MLLVPGAVTALACTASSWRRNICPREEQLSTNPPNRYRLLLRIAVKMVDESISTHDLGSARINLSAAIADKSSRTSAGLTREAWGQMCQSFLRKMADGWIERLMAQPPPLFLKHFPFSFRIMSLICFLIILPENFKRRLYQFEEKDLRVGQKFENKDRRISSRF